MQIRAATESDLERITAIYNEIVRTSTAVYALEPVSIENRHQWLQARLKQHYPVLVAIKDEVVVGFSSFGEWRGTWPGYRYTVEHTVHVQGEYRGHGIGRELLLALLPEAVALQKHSMIGAVDASNEASIRFHSRLGFMPVATFREVGRKFGRWLDLVFVQRFLDPPGSARSD